MSIKYISHNVKDTEKLALEIAKHLQPGDVILFYGDLGAGKTTFVKALAKGLSVTDLVHSPTFTLIHEHEGNLMLYHIDLYRLDDYDQILNIGFEDYIYSQGVTCVEWSEKLGENLPRGAIIIKIENIGDNEREFTLWSDLENHNKMLEDAVKCIS